MTSKRAWADVATWPRWLVPVAAAALTLVWSAIYWRWYIDDTYIYLQFVRNLVERGEFSFNPGEPTYSVTGPLWVLMASWWARVVGDPVLAIKLLSIVSGIGALWVFILLARRVIGARPLFVWLAVLAWAADGWWARSPFSGMESAGAVLIVLAVIDLRMREYDRGFSGFSWSAPVAAIGIAIRPEIGLLFALALGYRLVVDRRLVPVLVEAATGVLVLSPLLVYLFSTFGTIVPNTFAAKRTLGPLLPAIVDTAVRSAKIIGATQGLAVVVLLAGAFVVGRQIFDRRHWLAWAWMIVLPLFYIVRGIGLFQSSRYLVMMTPLLVLYAAYALALAADRPAPALARPLATGVAALLLVQALAFQFAYVYPSSARSIRDFDTTWRYLGEWINENTPPDARVAATAIGIFGYYSERYVLDLGALLDPTAYDYPVENGVPAYGFLRQRGADYLVGAPLSGELESPHLEPLVSRTQLSGMGLADAEPVDVYVWRFDPDALR